MLIVWFFAYKKLAQFAVRCALPPRRSVTRLRNQLTINPLVCCICWAGLLGRLVFPPWNEGPNFGSYSGHALSRGCGAGLPGGQPGRTSPAGAEMEPGDEDAVGRVATVRSGPVSLWASQTRRTRVTLGRMEWWGLQSAEPPPEQEDTGLGERQAEPCPSRPDSPRRAPPGPSHRAEAEAER